MKASECTNDPGDVVDEMQKTKFAKRLRRMHISASCHRIFALPDVDSYDVACYQPQYIGRDNGADDYRLEGYNLPLDEDGTPYYLNRRLEDQYLGVYGSIAMWKSKADASSSPIRRTTRSKFGRGMNVCNASGNASSCSLLDSM